MEVGVQETPEEIPEEILEETPEGIQVGTLEEGEIPEGDWHRMTEATD